MNFQSAIKNAIKRLTQVLSDLEPSEIRYEVDILLSHVTGKSVSFLRTWPEQFLSVDELAFFERLVERRCLKEPVAYLVGEQGFWSFDLKVTPDTLIPRPETELLVEIALEKIPLKGELKSPFRLVDLGTGTGAIAMALAQERPNAEVFALDFSTRALDVARHNIEKYSLKNISLHHSNWLSDWSFGNLDLVVSNPPYIAFDDPHLTALAFEPNSALVALEDGFADFRIIAEQAFLWLKKGGFLMFEHGFEQAEEVSQILRDNHFSDIQTRRDLSGNERVTIGQKVPQSA